MLFTIAYFLVMTVIFSAILGASCLVVAIAMKGRAFVFGTILVRASEDTSDLLDWLFRHRYQNNWRAYGRSYAALSRFLVWVEVTLTERHRSWGEAIGHFDWQEPLAAWERELLDQDFYDKQVYDERVYDQDKDGQ